VTEHLRLDVADVRALPLAAASVDAIVCDPPYDLTAGKKGGTGEASVNLDSPYGRARITTGFMGKAWDGTGVAFEPATWREVLRVLKPGGHLVAFGGSRTWHRLACAIEDAGFEIRDCLMWLYGSGFPKSLDVSKAIDKARIEDEVPVRVICRAVRAAMDARGLKSRDLTAAFGECHPRLIDHWAARDTDSQPALPTPAQWLVLKHVLGLPNDLDPEVERLNARKGDPGDAWQSADILGEYEGVPGGLDGQRFSVRDATIRAATDAASQWDGWGTALKPAFEPIVLARKPLSGTVAQTVLAHGTGALNIDGTRIGTDGGTAKADTSAMRGSVSAYGDGLNGGGVVALDAGRWPANVLLDEDSAALLDQITGEVGGGFGTRGPQRDNLGYGFGAGGEVGYGDSGGASRFFYTAKSSRREREAGLEAFAPVRRSDGRERDIENPRLRTNERRNHHPTVKPVDLMRWLVRLVTPPNGIVLDPFLGSGSTGMAALDEGMRFIGFDLDPEYVALARQRIAHRHVLEGRLLAAGEGTEQLVLL
jgi:DNA modification methylase